jgi:hypothetical protein
MAEKTSAGLADSGNVIHDEKHAAQSPIPDLDGTAGRRKSVALNIIENPLKVSLAKLGLRSSIASPKQALTVTSNSVSLQRRMSLTHELSPNHMPCPNTPLFLPEQLSSHVTNHDLRCSPRSTSTSVLR